MQCESGPRLPLFGGLMSRLGKICLGHAERVNTHKRKLGQNIGRSSGADRVVRQ
jgi:hypothetical protein